MAIDYGSVDEHLRVGIDVDVAINTATYQRIVFSFYADPEPDGWGWNDDMFMKISGHAGSSTVNFHKNANNNQLIATRVVTRDKQSTSTNVSVSCTIGGAFNGATPSASRTHVVPAKATEPPAPPSKGSIEFTNIGKTSAYINWGFSMDDGGSDINGYQFQVATATHFSGSALKASQIQASRGNTVTGLDPATKHYVRIRCRNVSDGFGNWSAVKDFTTDPTVPGLVAGRGTDLIGATSARVFWDAPAYTGGRPISLYTLRWRPVGTAAWNENENEASDLNRVLPGLTPGQQYEFRVRAHNAVGPGDYQDTSQLFTTLLLPPASPPRPTIDSIGATTARVNWSAPSAQGSTITGYTVRWSLTSSFTESLGPGVLAASARSYDITGLSAGTLYYIRVRAESSEGPGAWSPSKSFSTTGLTTPYPVVKYWDGTAWVRLDPTSAWDGTDWEEISNIKYWNGTTWVDIKKEVY